MSIASRVITGARYLALGGLAACAEIPSEPAVSLELQRGPGAPTHPLGTVAAAVALPGAFGVDIHQTGAACVAVLYFDAIQCGDGTQLSFPTVISTPGTPNHVVISPDGRTAFVTLQSANAVAVVDLAAAAEVKRIPLDAGGFNLIHARRSHRLYVTDAEGTLYVIDSWRGKVMTTLSVGPSATGLAFAFDRPEARLFVTSRDAGTLSVVDTRRNIVVATYQLGGAPQRVAVSADGTRAFVANEASGLDVVELTTGSVWHLNLGPGFGLGITPDGSKLYFLSLFNEVQILDAATLQPDQSLFLGGTPREVAFSADGSMALVTNEASIFLIQ